MWLTPTNNSIKLFRMWQRRVGWRTETIVEFTSCAGYVREGNSIRSENKRITLKTNNVKRRGPNETHQNKWPSTLDILTRRFVSAARLFESFSHANALEISQSQACLVRRPIKEVACLELNGINHNRTVCSMPRLIHDMAKTLVTARSVPIDRRIVKMSSLGNYFDGN